MTEHALEQEIHRLSGEIAKLYAGQNERYLFMATSLQTLTTAITGLQTAVALIPAGAPVAGDPGATAAQVNAAAAAIAAQTAILTADVAAAPANVIPLAPASFTAVSAGSGNVSLSFTPSAGATSYNVHRSTTTGTEKNVASVPAPAATTPPTPVTFSDTGLTVGTAYFYEVTAVNAAGESPLSLEVTVTA